MNFVVRMVDKIFSVQLWVAPYAQESNEVLLTKFVVEIPLIL
jgi:hypothetical protein